MKYRLQANSKQSGQVAPVRERGLKLKLNADDKNKPGRSREGAWIEIKISDLQAVIRAVAPVRERGLKL